MFLSFISSIGLRKINRIELIKLNRPSTINVSANNNETKLNEKSEFKL